MTKEENEKRIERLKNIVLNMPEKPGSYQFYDADHTIIYVGKAKRLKQRVSSYFHKEVDRFKTKVLVSKIEDRRGCAIARKQSYKEIQPSLQCFAQGRQDIPQHLHHERIPAACIQDTTDKQTLRNILRTILAYWQHVRRSRTNTQTLQASHLPNADNEGRYRTRQIQTVSGIPHS